MCSRNASTRQHLSTHEATWRNRKGEFCTICFTLRARCLPSKESRTLMLRTFERFIPPHEFRVCSCPLHKMCKKRLFGSIMLETHIAGCACARGSSTGVERVQHRSNRPITSWSTWRTSRSGASTEQRCICPPETQHQKS